MRTSRSSDGTSREMTLQMPLEMLANRAELHRKSAAVTAGGADPDQREIVRLARPQ